MCREKVQEIREKVEIQKRQVADSLKEEEMCIVCYEKPPNTVRFAYLIGDW